jgi:hypothetical protein
MRREWRRAWCPPGWRAKKCSLLKEGGERPAAGLRRAQRKRRLRVRVWKRCSNAAGKGCGDGGKKEKKVVERSDAPAELCLRDRDYALITSPRDTTPPQPPPTTAFAFGKNHRIPVCDLRRGRPPRARCKRPKRLLGATPNTRGQNNGSPDAARGRGPRRPRRPRDARAGRFRRDAVGRGGGRAGPEAAASPVLFRLRRGWDPRALLLLLLVPRRRRAAWGDPPDEPLHSHQRRPPRVDGDRPDRHRAGRGRRLRRRVPVHDGSARGLRAEAGLFHATDGAGRRRVRDRVRGHGGHGHRRDPVRRLHLPRCVVVVAQGRREVEVEWERDKGGGNTWTSSSSSTRPAVPPPRVLLNPLVLTLLPPPPPLPLPALAQPSTRS